MQVPYITSYHTAPKDTLILWLDPVQNIIVAVSMPSNTQSFTIAERDPKRDRSNLPLVVDLDGTLVNSDLLIESFLGLARTQPLVLLRLFGWLREGKAVFKAAIARRVDLDIAMLPYNGQLVDWLRAEKARGRPLVLATASNRKYAEQVSEHLGLFDEILASDETLNLSAHRKRDRLIERYGREGFDYAGNARDDLEVWPAAREAVVVNPSSGVLDQARAVARVTRVFSDRSTLKHHLRALRPHQWLKNTLVFVPLFAAHLYHQPIAIVHALLAFIAFSLCASGVYVLNDLLDLEHDRYHRSKRDRPFAAGAVPIAQGLLLIPVLLACAALIGAFLNSTFLLVLSLYFAITVGYSINFKRRLMADVITLAILYTMRIIAGVTALAITPSFWLLAFSMFFFLSLAIVKRYSELIALVQNGDTKQPRGRAYHVDDTELLASLGGASGYLSVLVLALYINSADTQRYYSQPEIIWLACPLLLFWVSRVWVLAHRGMIHDDPVVFALRDRVSRVVLLLFGLVVWAAI
jgi:4-hydroxybenzoate polyprenyltransferase/phosphoserine phosphatase